MTDLKVRITLTAEGASVRDALRQAQQQFRDLGAGAERAGRQMTAETGRAARAIDGIGSAAKAALPLVAAGLLAAFQEASRLRRIAAEVGQVLSAVVGIGAAGVVLTGARNAIREAADFEAAIGEIDKVSGLSRPNLQGVAQDIRALTREIPLPARALAEIGEAAGQLNLVAGQYQGFIRAVATSATAFRIPAAEAGAYFGQLINNFRLTVPQAALLADSINTLADSIANVSERDLLNVASRSAAAAKIFGLSAVQLNALAASLLSTGAPAEIAATAINTVLARLGSPEAQDPKFIGGLARLGLSAQDFTQAIGVDAQGALRDFLGRIRELDGQGQRNILATLFGPGGDANAVASLVLDLDRYDTALARVADTTAFAGSVQRAFAKDQALAISQYKLLRNAVAELKQAVGEPLLAGLGAVAGALAGIVQGLASLASANPLITQLGVQIGTLFGALTLLRFGLVLLGPLLTGLKAVASAVLLPIVAALQSAAGAGLAFGARLAVIGRLLLVALGGPIGVAVAALFGLARAWQSVAQETVTYQGVVGTVSQYVVAALQTLGDLLSGFVRGRVALLTTALQQVGTVARVVANAMIGALDVAGQGIGLIADGIRRSFTRAFASVSALTAALGDDIRAALAGDFSFSGLQAALRDAGAGIRGEFAGLQRDLSAAAAVAAGTDYLGAAGAAIRQQAGEIADAAGAILRVPLDAIGNAVAGRVASNQARPDVRLPGAAGGGGGADLPPTPAAAAAAAQAADRRREEGFAHFQDVLAREIEAIQAQAALKDELRQTQLRAEGRDYEANLATLTQQYQGWLQTLGRSAEGVALADRVFDTARGRLLADELERQASDLVSGLSRRSESRARRAEGAAPAEAAAARAQNAADFERSADTFADLVAQAQAIGGPVGAQLRETLAGIAADLEALMPATQGWMAHLLEVANLVTGSLQSGFEGVFSGLLDGTKSLSQGFRDLASSVLASLQQMIARSLAFYAVQQLIGAVSGGRFSTNSSGVLVATDAAPQLAAGGGLIRGPGGPTDDAIPARLSNGEYVIRAAIVQRFGRGFFDALNAGVAPQRFALGGLVGGAPTGAGAAGAAPVIQIINQGAPMRAERTEQSRTPDGRDLYRLFVAPQLARDIADNGPITQALSGALGLTRSTARR